MTSQRWLLDVGVALDTFTYTAAGSEWGSTSYRYRARSLREARGLLSPATSELARSCSIHASTVLTSIDSCDVDGSLHTPWA